MHRSTEELEGFVDHMLAAPSDGGVVDMIVIRPDVGERVVVETAELDTDGGLVGDNWAVRGSSSMADGSANPEAQLTLMNSRVTQAIAGTRDRWPLAGDQVYVDMDLSVANLPPGTLLSIGEATIRISETPHTGCAKFSERFGPQALRFANVGIGKENRFRGVNTSVVDGGRIQVGDTIKRL